ncbi:hypothetical protein C5B90_19110 [Haloferax sp. Atlit-12N]|uniref:Eco57I restriction-modification methylase domain-containing protein n=1 Tax=Haloferax sp. Atlit-12N TaxID=2077203 RepID=UPI000E23F652|nr:Eco57I restriction-modification methylase domain-containing protein [Haloferax sp. Atlit-12N]RDZ61384.1 hypothetical protein C5B90_19110 [Haloferax sp. Atlit-12N]
MTETTGPTQGRDLGFVETPTGVADCIANNLIHRGKDGRALYPGLGRGRIRDAVASVARRRNATLDEVGVERDCERIAEFQDSHPDADVDVRHANFLLDPPDGEFDYIAMNPPYVRYSDIPDDEREAYRDEFDLATGKFDLFHLFVEQATRLLADDGVFVMVIPTTWYGSADDSFREFVADQRPHNHVLVPDDAFDAAVSTCVLAMDNMPDGGSALRPRENPHPYDLMDLAKCGTIDSAYYDRVSEESKRIWQARQGRSQTQRLRGQTTIAEFE